MGGGPARARPETRNGEDGVTTRTSFGKAWRAGAAMLGALALGAASPADGDRYKIIIFQDGAPPAPADVTARVLPVAWTMRPDIGGTAIYIETDQAGLARVREGGEVTGPKLVYRALGPRVPASDAARLAPDAQGEARTYYLFAHMEPAEGKDALFGSFYDATHLPEILAVPGMQGAVRGELVSKAPETFGAPRYVAVYEFRSHDIDATMGEIDRRMKAQVIRPFPEGSTGPDVLIYYAGPAAPAPR